MLKFLYNIHSEIGEKMKKLIFLPLVLLFQCAPVAVLTGCSLNGTWEPEYTVPTTTDGRGATQSSTTSTTSTTGT